jgi:UDP-2-acetamido-3-amino-2,3-dideoxy-glucuronate N-acetyltransferase
MFIIQDQKLLENMNTKNISSKEAQHLGANCTIVCGVTIGKFAFIGAGAVISKDVPDYALMVGVPAKQIGWMSEYGEKLDLPLKGNAETICKHTNQKYQLKDDKVFLKIKYENRFCKFTITVSNL